MDKTNLITVPFQTPSTDTGEIRPLSCKAHIHHSDCRSLDLVLGSSSVDVTITSPPYFNLKDYGSKKQIGFGQTYEQYLTDLEQVFRKVHDVTKPSGSLWIVIDTFRRNHELVPLPFDLARQLANVGWVLQDIVIWRKERTVPWVPKGKTRGIFEYVLFFKKGGDKFKYYADRIRERDTLKSWWVKYPERYNPSGKLPHEIWEYDIPVQGSWGNGDVRHFCPLPSALINRILDLVTDPGDIVLDPFAGSGAVLLQALHKDRVSIGFETNRAYVSKIKQRLRSANNRSQTSSANFGLADEEQFYTLIVQLRRLKYARVLLKRVATQSKSRITILVEPSERRTTDAGKITSARYVIFCDSLSDQKKVSRLVEAAIEVAPLSKFGIEAEYKVVSRRMQARLFKKYKRLYGYTKTNTHAYNCRGSATTEAVRASAIASPISVSVRDHLLGG